MTGRDRVGARESFAARAVVGPSNGRELVPTYRVLARTANAVVILAVASTLRHAIGQTVIDAQETKLRAFDAATDDLYGVTFTP
jgi:hypothetical protein